MREPRLKNAVKRGIVRSKILSAFAAFQPPKVIILRYHSVLEEPTEHADSIGSSIIHASEEFARHMEFLSRNCHVLTMDEVLSFAQGGLKPPPRSVAVTFDDGFADNLSVAIPIMNRYSVPGTIYMMTGYASSVPWYCALRYAFAKTQLTSFIDPYDGTTKSLGDPNARFESYLSSSRACASKSCAEIDDAIVKFEDALQVQYRPRSPIMLSWDGVRDVIHQGHTIGSHTLSHPNLAYVSLQEARKQMIESRETLECKTGQKIRHFSYPSPIMQPHWTADTVEACGLAGYDTAVTCEYGFVRLGDSPLSLQRIHTPNRLDEFIWSLENKFAGRNA